MIQPRLEYYQECEEGKLMEEKEGKQMEEKEGKQMEEKEGKQMEEKEGQKEGQKEKEDDDGFCVVNMDDIIERKQTTAHLFDFLGEDDDEPFDTALKYRKFQRKHDLASLETGTSV